MATVPSPDDLGHVGQEQLGARSSWFNAMTFLVRQLLGQMATATLVEVVAVTNSGGLQAVGYVDVHPLVNQIDGQNNATPHAVIFNVPYHRLQGGKNAVIIDPEVGDIGIAIFASRDISAVKANRGESNPGSFRRFDWADALYIGGVLNGVPEQFVQFSAAGIKVSSPTKITLDAPEVDVIATTIKMTAEAGVTVTATDVTMTATDVTMTAPAIALEGLVTGTETAVFVGDVVGALISLSKHTTSLVQPGSGVSGPPLP